MTESVRAPIIRSLTLSPDLTEVVRARRFVAEVATEAGFPEPRVFDMTLVASEAAANAVEHAPVKGHVEVRALLYPDRLEIQVEGPGEFQTPDRLKERHNRGLGLPLMAKLSDHLALYSGPQGGTLVSLIFYRPGMERKSEARLPPSIRELIDENELVSAITEKAPVGLFVLDPQLRFRWANGAYRTFLEEPYRSRDITGLYIGDVVPGAEETGPVAILRSVSQSGEPVYLPEYEFVGFARGITYWRWEVMPLEQQGPPPFDVLVVISEITAETLQRRQVEALAEEARQAAEAYKGESERLQTVLQQMPSGVIIADAPSGRLVTGNPQVARIWRHDFYASVDVTDYAGYKGFHTDGRPYEPQEWPLARSIQKAETVTGEEIRILRGDGTFGTILVSSSPILNQAHEVTAAVVVFDEITERKAAEDALRASEERFRAMIETAREGVIMADPDGTYEFVNPRMAEMLGYSIPEMIGKRSADFAFHDRAPQIVDARENLRSGRVIHAEFTFRRKDGSPLHTSYNATPIYDGAGQHVANFALHTDITERKLAEGRLQTDKALFRGVADIFEEALSDRGEKELGRICLEVAQEVTDSSVGFIGEIGKDGALHNIAVSEPGRDKRGRAQPATGAEPTQDFAAHSLLTRILREGKSLIANQSSALPGSDRLPAGHPSLANFLGVPLRRKDDMIGTLAVGNREGGYGPEQEEMLAALGPVVVEAFDRKRAEESLRQSEERLNFALEVSDTGAWEVDLADDTGHRSPGFYRIFGYESPLPDWNYDVFLEHVLPEDRAMVDQNLRTSAEGGTDATFECRIRRSDGEIRWIWAAGRHRTAVDGTSRLVGIVQDITDRKEAEESLRASEERHRLLAEENERLYRQQLDIAENLQVALLNIPSEIGRVTIGHLYRSATEAARVGGDFYDAFPAKGGHIAVLIGDVSGHGIQAARTATLVKDVVHAFTHQSLRTHEVLRRTNGLLVEKELPGFVTLFLGILDGESGVFRYSSAGHPEALLRRVSGEIQMLGTGSPPLGVYPDASWKSGQVELDAGDLLLLYTDGVLEARRNGEFFGEKRLEKIMRRKRITVESLPSIVLEKVLAFSGGTLTDDIAVLALSLNAIEGRPQRGTRFEQASLLR